jgi:Holliday junction DNA helicase RuvA
MYAYISGKLIEKNAASAIVEAGGVGYQLHIPVSTFAALPQAGSLVKVLTYFVVREDAQMLYGFYTEEERQIFRLLLSVSGVGPKIGLTVLSGIAISELKRAIIDGNLAVLTGVPGIGRKTAERLVVELREKMVLEDKRGTSSAVEKLQEQDARIEDSLRALMELGYRKQNAQEAIRKAVKTLEAEKYSVPDLIRASLKYVS